MTGEGVAVYIWDAEGYTRRRCGLRPLIRIFLNFEMGVFACVGHYGSFFENPLKSGRPFGVVAAAPSHTVPFLSTLYIVQLIFESSFF